MDNDHILMQIVSNLPLRQWLVLETVSQHWHRVVSKSWRSIKSLCIGNDLFDADDKYPAKIDEKDERLICAIIKRCGPYLLNLHFAPVNVRKPFFRNVGRFTARHEINENILACMNRYCEKLKVLDISYHIFSTWTAFEMLSRVPASLQVLLLEICRLDEWPTTDRGMTDLMNTLFNRCNLKVFSLWGSCYGYWTLSESDFARIPSTVTYLDLSQGFTVKINSLRPWIQSLSNLQQLHLERTSIDDHDLRDLVTVCRGKLRALTLAYGKEIRDFSIIASFDRLRYLRLDGNRDYLNDQGLVDICQACVKLRLLSIESCNSLTRISLNRISDLRYLRHLSVCSIQDFNDDCLAKICTRCVKLSSLQLKYCRRISRNGLVHLPNLVSLKYLGVSGLAGFDQSIAECLRMRCTKLRTIEAFNCVNYR